METSDNKDCSCSLFISGSHSLGTLIEWKREISIADISIIKVGFPLAGDIN